MANERLGENNINNSDAGNQPIKGGDFKGEKKSTLKKVATVHRNIQNELGEDTKLSPNKGYLNFNNTDSQNKNQLALEYGSYKNRADQSIKNNVKLLHENSIIKTTEENKIDMIVSKSNPNPKKSLLEVDLSSIPKFNSGPEIKDYKKLDNPIVHLDNNLNDTEFDKSLDEADVASPKNANNYPKN